MDSIALQVVAALVAWFILMFISTNLIGVLVRGVVPNPEMEEIIARNELLTKEHRKSEFKTNIVAFLAIILFLAVAYHFWNFGLVIASLLLMAARVPDLIWEIKHGRQLQLNDMKKPKLYLLTTLVSWASMPVVWYALYRM